jgi:hypothetical protein
MRVCRTGATCRPLVCSLDCPVHETLISVFHSVTAQPLAEVSTWDLSGGKRRPALEADNLTSNFESIV